MGNSCVLKRKIYNELLDWKKKSNGKYATLIEGARRVGKSTIVEEFVKNEYDSYILIDFNDASSDIKDLFINHRSDLNYIFERLQTEKGVLLKERKSAIIFDEVQLCPEARSLIKYLVADGRYDYYETGSLISLKKNVKDIVIPSEEHKIQLYPLDFEEFCWALGDYVTIPFIKKHFEDKEPLGSFHHIIMERFRTYLLVGGMPQAVVEYAKTKTLASADIAKREILSLYMEDINKYGDNYSSKIMGIYEHIPGELSKGVKRFQLSSIDDSARSRDFVEPFEWLKEAMLANVCYKVNDPSVGLSLTVDMNQLKCYSSDTGLLVTQSFDTKSYVDNLLYKEILKGNLSINEGMIAENYVAQALKAKGYKLFFYSNVDKEKPNNNMEIDFIIIQDDKLNPIEVKSGQYKKHTSLDRFKKKYKKNVGTRFILHTKDLKIEDDTVYIPLYMTMFL